MDWIEMYRDEVHGGGDWAFPRTLWSPNINRTGRRSRWWSNLLKVKSGDAVIHLRATGNNPQFVGRSTCRTDGDCTHERPPSPGEWSYARQFHRVSLSGYEPFPRPILLSEALSEKEDALRDYFLKNKQRPTPLSLFYVLQRRGGERNQRLQCQMGAYLSELDCELHRASARKPMLYWRSDPRAGARLFLTIVRRGETGSERPRENEGTGEPLRNHA
jgi:putative restriction endonuclease